MKKREKLKVLHQQLQDKWFVERGRYVPSVKRKEKLKVLYQQLQDKWCVRNREIFTFYEKERETKGDASTAA